MFYSRSTVYIGCFLMTLINPAFAEDEQTRAGVQGGKTEKAVEPTLKSEASAKTDQTINRSIATIIESSMSQQQAEASIEQDELTVTEGLPQASFLEVMDALAQFGDDKKLSDYIAQYYQDNPDVAQNKYPNLAYDAAITGMQHLLNYLIKHNPEKILLAYENGPTVLGYIAGDNQVEAAKRLLENQLDPNDPGNTDAEYPLYLAINSGNLQMITLLMDYGAKVHIGDRFHSPLSLLLDNNDLQILNVIHAYDFKLESTNPDLVRLLIDYLNSELVEEEVLGILLMHGFDPHQKNKAGKSFFTIAEEQVKTKDVLVMLKDLVESPVSSQDPVSNQEPVNIHEHEASEKGITVGEKVSAEKTTEKKATIPEASEMKPREQEEAATHQ
jgi:ankyrin repeat protein